MDEQYWTRIRALFLDALERPPEEWAAFLADACAGDTPLRQEVEALLAAHDEGHALALENRLLTDTERPDTDAFLGARIGPYRLLQQIGEGGMGTVYLAERADGQYRQQVALKLVRPGLRGEGVLRRFRVERQILARLTHPHIARLLDGGMTEDKQPYLVIQYIEGLSITTYFDAHCLSIEDRLCLFRTVCDAVQFAHQNLVVHRDLKPSNILVTKDGTVKLLDFGIAKLLDAEDLGVTMAETHSEVRVMTPAYAAPEQVRGEAVTTATDVYALGILLYELLTGHRPYRLAARTPADIERVICEEAPTRPSTVITTVQEIARDDGRLEQVTAEQVSAARGTQVARLRRRLRGDLDNIVMKALRKEPARRYGSAEQLGEDIGRHLDGRPVLAQKDTVGYRMGKFVRRHRIGVAMTAVLVVLLLGFSIVTAQQARELARERDSAELERDRAEQVVQVLVNLFETSDPTKVPGGDTLRIATFLERGKTKVLEDLADQPETQARMKQVLANMYRARSQFAEAGALLREALEQQQALKGENDPAAIAMYHDLARLTEQTGHRDSARVMFRVSLTRHRKLYGKTHASVAIAMSDLARVLPDDEEKSRLLHEAIEIQQSAPPEDLAASLNNLAIYYYHRDKLDEARRRYLEVLDLLVPLYGEGHPHVLAVMNNLAVVYVRLSDLEKAETIYQQILVQRRLLYGEASMPVANSLNNIGGVNARRGHYAQAEEAYREALAMHLQLVGPDHWRTANTARNVGRILELQQRYDEALPFFEQSIPVFERSFGANKRSAAYMRGQLGMILLRLGRTDEARRMVAEALRMIREDVPAQGHSKLADAQLWMGRVLLEVGDAPASEPFLRDALSYRTSTLAPTDPAIAEAQCELGQALAAQGRFTDAENLLLSGFSRFRTWGLADAVVVEQTRRAIIDTYTALGQPEKADAYRHAPESEARSNG